MWNVCIIIINKRNISNDYKMISLTLILFLKRRNERD